jgi:transcriptional regulator with XRE-family HTH domain
MKNSATLTRALAQVRLERELPPPSKCRQLRLRAGITQTAVAEVVEVNRASVSRWEAGSRIPTGANLVHYLEVLDLLRLEVES